MTTSNDEIQKIVDSLNEELETLQDGVVPSKRSMAPSEQEVVVSGVEIPEEQFLHCRATKGCTGKKAKKIQDHRAGYGRLLRFECLECKRTWFLTL